MDEAGRNRLVRFVRFLGDMLGPQTEIVVHFFDDDRSYVGAIVNGHVSGRDENAPLTGLARRFVEERVYLRQDSVRNYRGVARGNENIRSSTYFITDEHRNLEAMICFNIDTSEYVELAHRLLQLGHADDVEGTATPVPFANDDQGRPFIEYFSESLKDVVYSLVPKDRILSGDLKAEERIDVVRVLKDRGFFEVKGAVTQVAEALNISEPSVYRYLKGLDKK